MNQNNLPIKLTLPDTYLDTEVRDGYTISSEMKEVWAIQLDLLNELDRICKKHNIKYCADAGTLLGAVRHKGMIPWDDDLDVAMTREEFNKLNEVASKEFQYPYFWQTEETDPSSVRGHAQLRNSLTTGILSSEANMNLSINQGIFIDIFPFDNVPDDSQERQLHCDSVRKKKKKYQRIISFTKRYQKSQNPAKAIIKACIHAFLCAFPSLYDYRKAYEEFENECKKYNSQQTKFVADLYMITPMNRTMRYAEDFNDLVEADFEFFKVPIFKNYDRNLKNLYGDNYMKPVIGTNLHGDMILDAHKPYTEYQK